MIKKYQGFLIFMVKKCERVSFSRASFTVLPQGYRKCSFFWVLGIIAIIPIFGTAYLSGFCVVLMRTILNCLSAGSFYI